MDNNVVSSSSSSPFRITIFGAGAVGGSIACRIGYAVQSSLLPNTHVSLVVRGEHYRAIQKKNNSLILRVPSSSSSSTPSEFVIPFHTVTNDASTLGPQNLLIVAIKAHGWSTAIHALRSLINEQTIILCVQNGLPWYLYPHLQCINNPSVEHPYQSLIPPSQIIGSVVYLASSVVEPGIIEQYTTTPKIIFGDIMVPSSSVASSSVPSYSSSMDTLIRILQQSNLSSSSSSSSSSSTELPLLPFPLQIEATLTIANHIWLKLWGNIAFNLISVLTLSTMGDMIQNPSIYTLAYEIMEETQKVGLKIQPVPITFPQSIDERLKISATIPSDFKTSMYQDLLQGRPLEIDAIGGAVIELAKEYGISIPRIATIVSLVRLRNEQMIKNNNDDNTSKNNSYTDSSSSSSNGSS